jgi:ribosome-associated protein
MHHPDSDLYDDEGLERPSKTQLKKQSHDLQKLGLELAAMPPHRLAEVEMSELLRDAIDELRRTRSHEGRRRQLQYVGKIMRGVDAEPLREAAAAFKVPGARETLALHNAERWRDRLLAEDNALTEWMGEHPDTDVQALRTLIRNARKDLGKATTEAENDGAAARKGRAYRDLFQEVKSALATQEKAAQDTMDDEDGDDE